MLNQVLPVVTGKNNATLTVVPRSTNSYRK